MPGRDKTGTLGRGPMTGWGEEIAYKNWMQIQEFHGVHGYGVETARLELKPKNTFFRGSLIRSVLQDNR